MSWTLQQIRELKVGRYMVIDDEPCKILELTTSKPGKHGEAKARIVAVGIFDGGKRSVVFPVTHKVQVPIIDKRNAQVVSIQGGEVQLMDMETFEMFNLHIEDEYKDKLEPGQEVQYQDALGRRMIVRA
ncbi:MAG: translation initiation factor IF-5A [Candidatus Thermoplasmatota archaeon]|nr:translation initiation factor IF-5A [Candidatus Thermoplasmatota archaeon]